MLGWDCGRSDSRLIMSGVTLNSQSSSSGEVMSVSEPERPSKSVSVLFGEAVEEGVDASVATGSARKFAVRCATWSCSGCDCGSLRPWYSAHVREK